MFMKLREDLDFTCWKTRGVWNRKALEGEFQGASRIRILEFNVDGQGQALFETAGDPSRRPQRSFAHIDRIQEFFELE